MVASVSMDIGERIVAAYEGGNVSRRTVSARFAAAGSTVSKLVH